MVEIKQPSSNTRHGFTRLINCMNLWYIFITIHTIAATACFVAGLLLMSPDKAIRYRFLMLLFFWSLLLMLLFMIASTLSHWYSLSTGEQITFSGLAGLGLYMLYRSFEAKRLLTQNKFAGAYFDAVGFVLIALFDGFAIVSLLDINAPAWTIVSGGILAIIAGRYFVNRTKEHYLKQNSVI